MKSLRTVQKEAVRSKIKKIEKVSVSENIAQQILDLIANGDLRPGQRLPSERDLCKSFGVGRSSVREALHCLSILGVLDARVGEGTTAAVDGGRFLGKLLEWRLITERHDIENLMEVRLALEGVTAANAARTRTSADVVKLETLISKMSRFLDDAKSYAKYDLEFHVTLSKISGNALLFDMVTMIRGQLVKGLSKVLPLPNALVLSHKEHRAILEAVKEGDPEAARLQMHAHILAALARHREHEESVSIHAESSSDQDVREFA